MANSSETTQIRRRPRHIDPALAARKVRATVEVEARHPNPKAILFSPYRGGIELIVDVQDKDGEWHRYSYDD